MSKNKKKKLKVLNGLETENKIMWVVVLVLLCIFCFFGYVQYKQMEHEKGYPINNLTNELLKEEHCYEDVCVKDVVIYYEKDGISTISGKMYHRGSGVKDACVKIKFLREDTTDTYDFNICYFDLMAFKEIDIESYFDESQADLVFARDYELTNISTEEYDYLYQSYIEESE